MLSSFAELGTRVFFEGFPIPRRRCPTQPLVFPATERKVPHYVGEPSLSAGE